MKTIDLNFDIKHLNGATIGVAGEILAQHLSAAVEGDSLKLYTWAKRIHASEKLILDPSDFRTLTQFVENCRSMTNLAKGQLLEYLTDLKVD